MRELTDRELGEVSGGGLVGPISVNIGVNPNTVVQTNVINATALGIAIVAASNNAEAKGIAVIKDLTGKNFA